MSRDLRSEIVQVLAERPLTADEVARLLRVRRADVTDAIAAGGFERAVTPTGGSPRAHYWKVAGSPSRRVPASRRQLPTHEERLLAVLRDGRPHPHRDLYRLGIMVHSRAARLRKLGYRIDCRRSGHDYLYQLHEAS